ncbi:hypothetical protein K8R32_02800 [bacterium]|nr:hypothetical protein [bacterium]
MLFKECGIDNGKSRETLEGREVGVNFDPGLYENVDESGDEEVCLAPDDECD